MSGLLESTLGAVGQVGEAVDKVTGGRALRGALAGKPRELASFVPFSDTMGLTDAKDKTSGRDLTDAYGLTGKGDHSFGANAAGFLADNVLSPANLLGGAAAFKAAPTIAKGLTAGAKALSGLDLIDHIGSGAKALGSGAKSLVGKLSRHVEMPDGSLVHALGTVASDDDIRRAAGSGAGLIPDEAGALKYLVPHKPVDLDALRAETLPANASRPRRWSTDPAERAYYSADRGRRYAQRMSGREIPRSASGADGIPDFTLNAAFAPGGFNRQSGLLGALAKANPTGDLPWERAVRLGKEEGVSTSLVPPDEAALILARGGLVGPAGKTPLAWYAGKRNEIGLNGNQAAWTNNDLMTRLLGEKGPAGSHWFASDNPNAVMHHELGHAMHRQGLGLDEYSNSPRLEGFVDPNHAKYLERNLSRYSATDPYEGVAETVSALKGNQQFSPSVQQGLAKLLHHYGGNNLWQMLGDQKLLKPLGYSLLATLGVGGAASQQRGA